MNKLLFILLSIVCSVMALTSCGTGPENYTTGNNNISFNVSSGETNIALDKSFTMGFDVGILASTVTPSNFYLLTVGPSASISKAVAANICTAGEIITADIVCNSSNACVSSCSLIPTSQLACGCAYNLIATSSIQPCNISTNGPFGGKEISELKTLSCNRSVTPLGSQVTIVPSTAQTVAFGGTTSFTVTADTGYTLASGVGGTCDAGSWAGDVYTTGAVTEDCTAIFSATLDTHTVTPSGTNVTIDPSDAQTVNYGSTTSFTVTADTGYTLASGVGGTCDAGSWAGDVYTTGAITSDCTVTFSADINLYTVTPSGSHVTVNPSTPQTVAFGGTTSFTVTADTGYTRSDTVGGTCAAGSWASNVYTTGAITSDCTVTFSADTKPYSVGGTISGLDTDSSLSITLQNNGGDDKTLSANGSFTFTTKLATGDTYAVTVSAQPNGQTCHVSNGSGTIADSDVTNVSIYCAYFAYVTNSTDDSISIIDTTDNTIYGTITGLSAHPSYIALKPDGSTVYVSSNASNSVTVIDTATNEITGTITGLSAPNGVAVSPDGTQLYIANSSSGTVSVYNVTGSPEKVGDDISLGASSNPQGLEFKLDGSKVYVGTYGLVRYLSVINTSTRGITSIDLLNNAAPQYIAFTPDGTLAYVTRPWRNSIAKINTSTETTLLTSGEIAIGAGYSSGVPWPGSLAVTPGGTEVYVPNGGIDDIDVINISSNSVTATITGLDSPSAVVFSIDGSIAYVANSGSNTVAMINTTTRAITGTITVGNGPQKIAIQKPNPNR